MVPGQLKAEVDISAVVDEVIKRLPETKPGRDGRDGKDGAQGPVGPAGPQGPSGEVDYLQVGKIADEIVQRRLQDYQPPKQPLNVSEIPGTKIRLEDGTELGTLRIGEEFVIPQRLIPMIGQTPSNGEGSIVSHLVVVDSRSDRLERLVRDARAEFDRITIVPRTQIPENVVVRKYPTLVAYSKKGNVVAIKEGRNDVERLLTQVSRKEYP